MDGIARSEANPDADLTRFFFLHMKSSRPQSLQQLVQIEEAGPINTSQKSNPPTPQRVPAK
jgi:hypothetical protein